MGLSRRAVELRDHLKFLLRAGDADYVYFLEIRGRGVVLRAAPIDVSAIIREVLLDRMQATILTSATLTVDGSFDYVTTRLGIVGHERAGSRTMAFRIRPCEPGDPLPAAENARSSLDRIHRGRGA